MSALPPPKVDPRARPGRPPPAVYRRRRVVAAGGILAVAAAAIAAVTLYDGGNGGDVLWDAVVVLDSAQHAVSVVDPDGESIETLEVDGTPSSIHGPGRGAFVLLSDDDESVWVLDVSTGDDASVGAGSGEQVGWLRTSDAPVVVIGSAEGGAVRLLDAASGEVIDVGEVAGLDDPLILLQSVMSTPDGRTVVVTDVTSFQTVVVGFDRDEPAFAPGQVAAVGEAGFATLQPAGDSAELEFFDLDGENLGSVEVPRPRGLMLTGSDTALVVTADGRVLRAEGGAEEPDEQAAYEVTEGAEVVATPLPAAGRLLVHLGEETVLLDADGDEVARVDGGQLWAATTGEPACFATYDGAQVRLFSAETGDLLSEVAASGPVPPSGSVPADGCATDVRTASNGATVLTSDGTIDVDGIVLDIAPDGMAATVRAVDVLQLVPLDDADADPVILDGTVGTFATR